LRSLLRIELPVLALVLAASQAGADQAVSVGCRRSSVICFDQAPSGAVHLPHRLVVSSSDSLFADGRLLIRGGDYRMDYEEGIVYLQEPLGARCLRVSYSVFPGWLERNYSLRSVEEVRGTGSPPPRLITRPATPDPGDYDLRASGSKTISVETGTLKDVRVSQALDLSLGGTIGEAVEIRGVLSDKDLSLGNRSSTSKLRDLDRVFMEVRSASGHARVGDLEIVERPGELLGFERNMTGFLADARRGGTRVVASGAASRNRYRTAELTGREGISGPYAVGPDGARIEIVGGTEKVWLDGREMNRGSNADYTMDYSTGEIYFNPKHLMSEGSRIVVDYQSADSGDDRQLYFGSAAVGLGGSTRLAVSYVNEGYSAPPEGNPFEGDFEDHASLGSAPEGWADGATYVGVGKGSYIRIEEDSSGHYQYAGPASGDYDVNFTYVGEDQGRYSYVYSDSWDSYIYLYTGTGDYVDLVRVSPDLDSRVFHLAAGTGSGEWFEASAEAARSRGHRRVGEEWELRRDNAYSVEVRLAPELPDVGGRSAGKLTMLAKRRDLGDWFIGLDRLRSPDFLQYWGQEPEGSGERSNRFRLDYSLSDGFRAFGGYGTMETSSGSSLRRSAGVDLGDSRLGLSAGMEKSEAKSSGPPSGYEHRRMEIRVPAGPVQVSVGRDYEARVRLADSTARRLDQYYSRLRLQTAPASVGLRLAAGTEERDPGGGWSGYASSLEGQFDFEADAGRHLGLRGGVVHRRFDYAADENLPDRRFTSGDLHLSLRDVGPVSSLSLDYRLANTLTSVFGTRLVEVTSGGDYDSLGNYLPGEGTHVLSRYETGRQPVTRARAGMVLELGRRGRLLPDRSLSARTAVDLEGESVSPGIGRVASLIPGRILHDADMRLGRVELAQELVYSRKGGLTVSLDARLSRRYDARFEDRSERRDRNRLTGRLTGFVRGFTLGLEAGFSESRNRIQTSSYRASPRHDTWNAGLRMERDLTRALRGAVKIDIQDDRRTEPDAGYLQMRMAPDFTLFVGRLRCDAGAGYRKILRSETGSSHIPWRDTLDWRTRMKMKHGRYTSFSLEYSGRRSEGTPAVHNLRAALSATF
jgi:hypothetical protein